MKHLHDDAKLTAIADAIRLKRDITDEMTVDDMPMQIGLIGGGIPENAFIDNEYTVDSNTNTITFNAENVTDFLLSIVCKRKLTGITGDVNRLSVVVLYSGNSNSELTGIISSVLPNGSNDGWGANIGRFALTNNLDGTVTIKFNIGIYMIPTEVYSVVFMKVN